MNAVASDLASLPASPPERRTATALIAALGVMGVLAAPFAPFPLPAFHPFAAIYGGAVLMGYGITATFLFVQFWLSRKASLLALACGALFSTILLIPYLVVFPDPGVTSAVANTTGYLWTGWHLAFPAGMLAYVRLRRSDATRRVSAATTSATIIATILSAYAIVHVIFAVDDVLPHVVRGPHYAPFAFGVLGFIALLSAVSLVALLRIREKTVIDVWLLVPAAAFTLEAVLNGAGLNRFTVGWYVSRLDLWVATASLVIALLIETNRISRIFSANERRLRGIVDGVTDALVLVDSRGAILSVNPAGAELFGFDAQDLIGSPISRIVPDYAAVLLDADGTPTETVGRDAHGTPFAIEVVRGRDAPGELGETILIVRDITKRKATEEAIRTAHDKAIEAADVKAQFLAMMSHEIRTPINAVVGMSELMLQTSLNEEAREYAITVRDSAESLLAIVNDILDFSKAEAGRMELEASPFAPVVAVENATDILAATARKKGLSLSTYVAPEVPRRLLGDVDRLRQVLLNLIGNAVKFTSQGSVTVRATVESDEVDRVVLRFSVADTGPGISPEVGEGLFEPFRQADQSTRRRYGGTGLGLSISRRIVELMGGRIGFDSSPGRGSTFWFTAAFPRAADETPVERGDRLRGTRILVVDDDPVSRQVVDQYLVAWGAIASSTGTASHALELAKAAAARRNAFDAIIIDRSAGGDGFAFAVRLGNEPAVGAVPMLLLSGGDETITSQDARTRGFAAVLRKPLRQNALHDALVSAINGTVPAPVKPPPEASENVHNVLVLVAEDNPVNRKLALQQLKRLGYGAHAVADGREAIDAAASGDYDLVLMDCQMPEVDGFEATREIRRVERERGGHLPIIAMTANALEGDREACLAAGMDDYLAKPVQLSALRAAVERYANGVGVGG